MRKSRVEEILLEDVAEATVDARLVAVRWDLKPWSLVFDLDSPIAEGEPILMRRLWLCFHHLSEVTLPWQRVRMPVGCWLTTAIETVDRPDGMSDFRIGGLFHQMEGDEIVPMQPIKEIIISAVSISAFGSTNAAQSSEYGLERQVRQGLASDEELLTPLLESGE